MKAKYRVHRFDIKMTADQTKLEQFLNSFKLKEWECVEVKHHKDVGKTIEEWQKKGWRLHSYQTAGMGAGPMAYNINHYLLFERGE